MAGIHRRQFLQAAGIAAGAAAVTCAGLGYAAVRPPSIETEFFEGTAEAGDNGMNRILIAYASKLGSTGDVARALAEELTGRGFRVDVKRVGDAADVSPYGSVLVGSAVRMGRWLPEAVQFLEAQAGPLAEKPVSYFSVCMTMAEDTPGNRAAAKGITAAAHAVREPDAEEFFAGRMEYGRVSFVEQMILRAKKTPEGDFRNWDSIRAWARQVPAG